MRALHTNHHVAAYINRDSDDRETQGTRYRASKSAGRLAVLLTVALVACLLPAAMASAKIQITSFGGSATNTDGTPLTQAGAHPDLTTKIRFAWEAQPYPDNGRALEGAKDILLDLPPGLVGAPAGFATCAPEQLTAGPGGASAVCPIAAQVGVISLGANGADPDSAGSNLRRLPIYNVTPVGDSSAQLAANLIGTIVRINTGLRTSDDGYRISADSISTSQAISLTGIDVTLWGVPADPSHDVLRYFVDADNPYGAFGAAAGVARHALMTSPTRCASEPLVTKLRVNSWEDPDEFDSASFSSDFDGNPLKATGCDKLPFAPTASAQPTSSVAGGPTGLDVRVDVPQNSNPDGLASAQVKKVVVTLPEGMAVNPSSADGLAACSPTQIGIGNNNRSACPDGAKIGSVSLKTPLIDDELTGDVYLASQNDNPFHSTFAMYIVARGPGLLVKLAGRVDPDPATGRLTATFDDNPELPFGTLKVHLNGGERAPLANPALCGTYPTSVELTSWASTTPVVSGDAMSINQGCDRAARFEPSMRAGLTNPSTGSDTSFVLNLSRPDGQQDFNSLDVTLPAGVLGNVGSVPQCPEAQAAAGTCSDASRIGSTTVSSGAGGSPVAIPQPGKAPTAVYLAGPYKGAPFSLSVLVPAQAGPLNLGNVVVRAALFIDPIDAHVTVKSDPLPTILLGVPLKVQSLTVTVDRSRFIVTPTNCNPTQVGAHVTSTKGAAADLANRFQVGGCSDLALKPGLGLTLSGKGQTTDGKHPAVSATLTQPGGQANLKRVRVALPLSLALDPDNANGLCEFVDGSKAEPTCPKASIVGTATAKTPILDEPLTGPVYFVKNVRKDPKSGRNIRTTPKLVIPLVGQNGVKLTLTGTSTVADDQLVTTFDNIPDAPVSSFKLDIIGGKGGILVVSGADICKATQVADQQIDGQNGKNADTGVFIQTPSCPLKVLSKKVTAKAVTLKVGGLGAGKVTVTGKGIKKTTKTITKSTVATITAKRTKGKPGKVTVSYDPTGPAKAHKTTK